MSCEMSIYTADLPVTSSMGDHSTRVQVYQNFWICEERDSICLRNSCFL